MTNDHDLQESKPCLNLNAKFSLKSLIVSIGTPQFVLFLMLSLFYKGQLQFVLREVIVCSTGKQQFVLQEKYRFSLFYKKNILDQLILLQNLGCRTNFTSQNILTYRLEFVLCTQQLEIVCTPKQNELCIKVQIVLLLPTAYK